MEEKNLIKFNGNIKIINNELVKYEDDEGNLKLLNIGSLLCQVQFLRVEETGKKVMLFNKEISKDMKFNKEFAMIPQRDEKNPLKVKEVETQVELMWKVQNGLGFSTVFNNKEEAIKYAEDINNLVLGRLGVENGKE